MQNAVMNKDNLRAAGQNSVEELDVTTFEKIRSFVHSRCGISLCDRKKPLVSSRIRKRMRELQIPGPKEYFTYIQDDPTGMEVQMLLDSIATNVTAFFREAAHMDFLKEKANEWMRAGQKRLRFWCAACSSGEEPYSMAFVLRDAAAAARADVKILASDISTKVLGLAHQGLYSEASAAPVPAHYREKFMEKIKSNGGVKYMVRLVIKDMLAIQQLNLTQMPFPMKGPLDMIFCRNVMIYFDKDLRKKLVAEFYRLLKPGGYLIVGHTESLIDLHAGFKRTGPSIYMK